MADCIDGLFELCNKQPLNIEKIQCFITSNNMNSEEVTRAALKLCDYGMFSYSDYLYEYEKEPAPCDLRTYNWELLFNVLIDNGLDANLVICDDGRNFENILQSVKYFDDGDLAARVLRNILSKGFSPNIVIDDISFFEDVDDNFIMDIDMGLYPHKWQVDNAFRFWLVLIGFGGVIKGDKLPVNMCNNYTPKIFKEFEKFDYEIVCTEKDFELRIIEKETNNLVATV